MGQQTRRDRCRSFYRVGYVRPTGIVSLCLGLSAFVGPWTGCRGACGEQPQLGAGDSAQKELPTLNQVRVSAEDMPSVLLRPVIVDATRSSRAGTRVRLAAQGPREAWVSQVDLTLQLEAEGRGIAGEGRCIARYLDGGRLTEAELRIERAMETRGPADALMLDVTCAKRFAQTASARPYAAPLPDSIRVQGAVRGVVSP